MSTRMMTAIGVMLCAITGAASAQEGDRAAYEARLKAGRETAYKKFLPQPPAREQPGAKAGERAAPPVSVYRALAPAPRRVVIHAHPSAAYIFAGRQTPYAFGDLRYNFYDNLNLYRRQRYTDFPLAPYIYQPVWDWRYRRSWPRPVTVRRYIASHWLFDGVRYTYVPGHAEYETRWVTQGWPRYRWRGAHYSVSVSFNR